MLAAAASASGANVAQPGKLRGVRRNGHPTIEPGLDEDGMGHGPRHQLVPPRRSVLMAVVVAAAGDGYRRR